MLAIKTRLDKLFTVLIIVFLLAVVSLGAKKIHRNPKRA